MNRTLKEATVRRYHYDSHHQLRQHIQTFLDADNFAKRLKTLNGLTPFESVCKAWTKEPNRFKYIRSSSLRDYTARAREGSAAPLSHTMLSGEISTVSAKASGRSSEKRLRYLWPSIR
jgi:hypothetical protein